MSTAPSHELDALLSAMLDSPLNADQRRQLSESLASADNLAAYLDWITVHTFLRRQTGAVGVVAERQGFRIQGSEFSFKTAGALAALLLLAAALFYVFLPSTPHSALPTPHSAAPATYAILSDLSNDVAFADADHALGSDLAGPIKLIAGKAQLMFKSTAVVDLTGPCEFAMTGSNRGELHRGSLVAYVPPNARGFSVYAPHDVRIVDLGTRFELSVDRSGQSMLQIFEGRVQLHLGGSATHETHTFGPGLAMRIVDGRLVPLPPAMDLTIAGASFESPRAAERNFVRGMDGWRPITPDFDGGVNRFGSDFDEPIPDGRQLAFINAGAIEQTLDARLAAGVRYTLSVMVGHRPGPNHPDYTIALHAGDELLTSATNPVIPPAGRFASATLSYDCPANQPALGQPLRIVLQSNGSLKTHVQNHFDMVQLRAETISPATLSKTPLPVQHTEGDQP
ncbi:MAG: hypothetical protein GC162_03465 [Planctomycetes bacterium]|nr:hypothetical protein [Planctomycetota bacterium]